MKLVPNAVSLKVGRQLLLAQKASPKTLFITGLVGMGATVVLACRATLKVEPIVADAETGLKDINDHAMQDREYAESHARKDKVYLFGRAGLELTKVYGPSILCGVLSISALIGSQNLLSKRNAALMAAYGAMEKSYGEYRDRVAAKYGREAEEELYRDILPCEIDDETTGKKAKVKKANRGGSPYARLFDEHNVNWSPAPEYNFLFLKAKQAYWNNRLHAWGHVFLNEIYDDLGMERSSEGAVVGWVKDGVDGYIDFGIFNDDMDEHMVEFMVGREKAVWLDFNVDGVVYDKINQLQKNR